MELIIKIDEDLYEAYKGRPPMLGDAGMDTIAQAIANGTPLPKGHGELIDRDKLAPKIHGVKSIVAVLDAETIIEADKENDNE